MSDYFHRLQNGHNKIDNCKGGWRCPHCGPNPKHRQFLRRMTRRIDRQRVKAMARGE